MEMIYTILIALLIAGVVFLCRKAGEKWFFKRHLRRFAQHAPHYHQVISANFLYYNRLPAEEQQKFLFRTFLFRHSHRFHYVEIEEHDEMPNADSYQEKHDEIPEPIDSHKESNNQVPEPELHAKLPDEMPSHKEEPQDPPKEVPNHQVPQNNNDVPHHPNIEPHSDESESDENDPVPSHSETQKEHSYLSPIFIVSMVGVVGILAFRLLRKD